MFGPAFLDQLKQLKEASEQGMAKLPEYVVEGTSGNGLIRLKLDGTYALKELKVATDIHLMDVEDLEDFLALALKQAIDQVTAIREQELMHSIIGK